MKNVLKNSWEINNKEIVKVELKAFKEENEVQLFLVGLKNFDIAQLKIMILKALEAAFCPCF